MRVVRNWQFRIGFHQPSIKLLAAHSTAIRDLLLYRTATVPELSHKDQERIAIMDITDATNIDVIQLQQHHYLVPCIWEQWQMFRQEDKQHSEETNGGTNEYGMVRLSHTSHGAGNGRPGEGKDDSINGRTQMIVHAFSRQFE